MKIYRVVDNATTVLVTVNELEALRRFRKIMEKHDVTWGRVEDLEVK